MMRRWLIVSLALACAACSAPEPPVGTPGAAVEVASPTRGSLPNIVRAYGVAEPSANGSTSVNAPLEGQVSRWIVVAGQTLRRGDPLLEFTPSPASLAMYRQLQHALTLASEQRSTAHAMFERQLATRDQLAQADKAFDDARAALASLPPAGAADGRSTLTTPTDGVVASLGAVAGNQVAAGSSLVTLVRAHGLSVRAGVEPADASRVHPGQSVELHALDENRSAHGQVTAVAGALDSTTRLVTVVIDLDQDTLAGTAWRADIQIGTWQGWRMPCDSIVDAEGDAHVFQVDHGKAHRVKVQLLGSQSDSCVVSGSIDAQLPLVIVGASPLDDDLAVRATTRSSGP